MPRTRFLFAAAALTTLGCTGGGESATSDSGAVGELMPLVTTLIGETGGMKTPESVRYDSEVDYSSPTSTATRRRRMEGVHRHDRPSLGDARAGGGRQGGATLNAPKAWPSRGYALVADIDAVRGQQAHGAPVATIDLSSQQATFLNDLALGPNGALYVTDSGIRFDANGAMTHPAPTGSSVSACAP